MATKVHVINLRLNSWEQSNLVTPLALVGALAALYTLQPQTIVVTKLLSSLGFGNFFYYTLGDIEN